MLQARADEKIGCRPVDAPSHWSHPAAVHSPQARDHRSLQENLHERATLLCALAVLLEEHPLKHALAPDGLAGPQVVAFAQVTEDRTRSVRTCRADSRHRHLPIWIHPREVIAGFGSAPASVSSRPIGTAIRAVSAMRTVWQLRCGLPKTR